MFRAAFIRGGRTTRAVCLLAMRFTATTTTTTTTPQPRVYISRFPSILPDIAGEVSLYGYMLTRMRAQDQNIVASVDAEREVSYTYPELIEITERIAQMLYHEGGVRKGDVVSICVLNSALYGPLAYGILRLGAVGSPVNAVAAAGTLAYHFKTNKCTVVLGQKFFQATLDMAVNIAERETGNTIKVLYPEDFLKMNGRLDIPSDYLPLKDATPDDTILIPFSSGTTGLPKGVQLTNRNLIANTEQSRFSFGISPGEMTLMILPYFHIYGFTCGLNTFLSTGCTQVVMTKYSVSEYARNIERYKATLNLVAPPVFVSLVKNHDSYKHREMSSLRHFISGAAPLGAEVEGMFRALFPGVTVAQGYGMTEMSPLAAGPAHGLLAGTSEKEGRDNGTADQPPPSGAAGMIIPDTELRVVRIDAEQQSGADTSAGVDCGPGEEGEIWLRGPQMFKGYLNQSDTDATMQDGWYRTGDIGVYDEPSGYLTITDRLKELIKYKGFQVSPASIEAMLLQHPWVQDCIVVGVPDPRDVVFEMPRALVMLKPDLDTKSAIAAADSVYRFAMARSPPHKRLHGGVRIVDDVPRNASGKLMRRQVRSDEVEFLKETVATHHEGARMTAG